MSQSELGFAPNNLGFLMINCGEVCGESKKYGGSNHTQERVSDVEWVGKFHQEGEMSVRV